MPSESRNFPEIWIVSAFEPEQDQLQAFHGQQILLEERWYLLKTFICGVGNLQAASFLQKELSQNPVHPSPIWGYPPHEVIFVGSCGTYASEVSLQIPGPGLVFCVEFGLLELATLQGQAHQPALMPTSFRNSPGALGGVLGQEAGAVRGRLNCPNAVSLVRPADTQGWTHENLECGGLAFMAQKHRLFFSALLCVTNAVGPEGSAQWRANFRSQSDSLQSVLKKSLEMRMKK